MKGASRKPMVLLGLLLAVLLGLGGRALAADTALTITGSEMLLQPPNGWDTGALTISFLDTAGNSYSETVSPGQFSTANSIASAFGAKFSNQYYVTPVQAKPPLTPLLSAHAVGCTIYFHLLGGRTFSTLPTLTGPTTSFSSTVPPAVPVISWAVPAPITYGTALSSTQFTALVYSDLPGSVGGVMPGAFTYTLTSTSGTQIATAQTTANSPACTTTTTLPAAATPNMVLPAGAQTLFVSFVPNPCNVTPNPSYVPIPTAVTLNVSQATPTINWPTPASITDSAALSTIPIATSSVAGSSFTYSPLRGSNTLPAGDQLLTVTVTPPDKVDYAIVTVTRPITVTSSAKYDSGTVSLDVNGSAYAASSYGQGDTPSSVAARLASLAPASPVMVSAVDDELYINAAAGGSGSDYSYSISISNVGSPYASLFPEASFAATPPSGSLDGGVTQQTTGTPIYSYKVPAGGYDPAGNLVNSIDSVMGAWSFSYDTLNRLAGATDAAPTPPPANLQPINPSTSYCWSYDDFGNRTAQAGSTLPFTNAIGAASCTAPNNATTVTTVASYNANNQVTSTTQALGGYVYDASGDVTNDGLNQYLYDAEGRICAVYSSPVLGISSMTGYLYDADGTRVAKGSISAWSCDPTVNGFQTTNDYILGLGGEQLTEMGMGGTTGSGGTTTGLVWQHANIWAGGKLLGTYDKDGLHFYLDDPLGTRRAQTDAAGVLEQTCSSLPFGDGLACSEGDLLAPTENHFTGKERDTESGNDYFEARYYSSSMGRFMSPDWSAKVMPVPYAKLGDPQSLNLYAYVGNNPITGFDADGHQQAEGGSSDQKPSAQGSEASDKTATTTASVPSFKDLWKNYPTEQEFTTSPNSDGKSIWTMIGGSVERNRNWYVDAKGMEMNSCATRMSFAFNMSGSPLPFLSKQASPSGANPQRAWYYTRVSDFQTYLTNLTGINPPTLGIGKMSSLISNQQGIVEFLSKDKNHGGWGDATGHFALWNGTTFRNGERDNYSTNPAIYAFKFWGLK